MNKYDKQKQEEALLAIALWRESKLNQGAFCLIFMKLIVVIVFFVINASISFVTTPAP